MKASAVLVMPTIALQQLPAQELEVVSRFLFQTMRGLDEEHTRRWRRAWGRVAQGEILQAYIVEDRHGGFHRRHMAIESRVFENQDGFVPNAAGRRAFRNWLKVGASLVSVELHDGEAKFLPGSLSYEDASDAEMREFHKAAMDFLSMPRSLRKLWPAVKPALRPQMLEAAVRDPDGDQP